MHRFFAQSLEDEQAILSPEDAAHIRRVLRMLPGEILEVGDGAGNVYRAKLLETSGAGAVCRLYERLPLNPEPQCKVTLYQGLPKLNKMDWIVEKCIEAGVTKIVPVQMRRSVPRLGEGGGKLTRWRTIARAAATQCGRAILPEVGEPLDFDRAVEQLAGVALVPWEEEKGTGIRSVLQETGFQPEVSLIIGPEGGMEPEEVEALTARGAKRVSLGPRIFRTETAGVAVLSMLLYEMGDMGG